MTTRWLFADQLGPHFLDDPDDPGGQPVLLVLSRAVFRRRRFHRRKALLVVSAMLHRAAELGDRARLVEVDWYRDAVEDALAAGPVEVVAPTSKAADAFVRSLPELTVLPARGWAADREEFAAWTRSRGGPARWRLEDFVRAQRRRLGLLVDDGGEPVSGRWNYDAENREAPPRGVRRLADAVALPDPWWPTDDEVDEQARAVLRRWEAEEGVSFVGRDGPRRFAVTHREAVAAVDHFVEQRLAHFGPFEDAMLDGDPWMAHSLLSVPLNLGLLDPVDVARRAEAAYHAGAAPLASVEGFIRQVVGWRDYVWHVYWAADEVGGAGDGADDPPDGEAEDDAEGEPYRARNALAAHEPLPRWFAELDADAVDAACLSHALAQVRDEGWAHHIVRLMVLGSWALQRGYDPAALTDWFHRCFVDGYDWVMVPNVVGMSQHADGGMMATKPYTSGGAYLHRMSDFCGSCRYDPTVRVGDSACPFTAGYWAFLHRNRDRLAGNHRMAQPLRGLDRLRDLDALLTQEDARADTPP